MRKMIGQGRGILLFTLLLLALAAPVQAAAAADAAITAKVDDAKATFDAVLTAGLVITASMIGWGFLKRIRKG